MDYFEEETFDGIDFTGRSGVQTEWANCIFKNCNFAQADLSQCKFIDATFVDCNLSNAKIEKASFQEVAFRNCKMLGLRFDACNSFAFAVSFENCQLSHAIFFKVNLSKTPFINVQLQEVDFSEAKLKGAVLRDCDLLNAIFDNTDLENADLRHSINYSIDPENNRLKGAKFSLSEVSGLLSKYKIKIDRD